MIIFNLAAALDSSGKCNFVVVVSFRPIEPRNEAIRKGLINKQREPFSMREKMFWDITQAIKLTQPKFTQNLGHEPDGLIFQPSSDVCTILIFIHIIEYFRLNNC